MFKRYGLGQNLQRSRLESLEDRLLLVSDVVISEFQASNSTTLVDSDGDASDWIELHNSGLDVVSLAGWSLTDSATKLDKWRFPAVSIAPNTYLLVFASGKDRAGTDTELHANFSLSAEGEFLALVEPDGRSIASSFGASYPVQVSDVSFGPTSDGTHRYFGTPTPGAPNDIASSFSGIVATPTFSVQSGFYDAPFAVAIDSTSPHATIRYTLDSSPPTETSAEYTGPITIDGTTILRAAAFESDYLTVGAESRTYLFLDDVLRQDGAGLPETWGTFAHDFPLGPYRAGDFVPANYEMDPEVVDDPRYRETLKKDLRAIPTLSLVFDPEDLWSETTGIYSNTLSSGVNWERPVTAELIGTDGSIEFRVNAGARIQGAFSRRPSASAKHSFRLLFKSDYGAAKLSYPWFGDDAADEFETVVLRASYNYSWSRGERNNSQHAADGTFVQDRWAAEAQTAMGGLATNGTWVHLYLNGLYWGLYNPNERPDASFLASYLGGAESDYDVMKIGEVLDGDDEAWNELLSLVRQRNIDYEAVQRVLDVPGFVDYMMVNHLSGNEDWPHNNWYASRERSPGARWQFHSWDAELLFRETSLNRTTATNQVANGPGEIYNRLRRVEEFRVLFGDRIQQHFFHDGALTPAANIARLDQVAAPIDRAVVGESARWGDALFDNIDPALTRDDHWLPRIEELKSDFFPARTEIVLEQYRDIQLYPAVPPPVLSQLGGIVEPTTALSMAAADAVYFTLDGSDPRLPGGAIAPHAERYEGPVELDRSTRVQARVLADGMWSALVVADFVVNERLPLAITEIHYHPASPDAGSAFETEQFEFVEVMNVGTQPINVVGAAFADGVEFTFPSLLLAAGERAVVVQDVAAFRSRYGDDITIAGQFSNGRLNNSGETLRLVDARGETLAIIAYDNVSPWPERADGHGASLEVVDPLLADGLLDAPSNWRGSSRVHGTPGAEPSEEVGVVINEVLARTIVPDRLDAIEIWNSTTDAIDIGGWFLSDSNAPWRAFEIPSPTWLGPQEFIVFDERDFAGANAFALNGSDGDHVWLTRFNNGMLEFIDEVSFGGSSDGETWGRYSDRGGLLVPLARAGLGHANFLPRVGPVVISEVNYSPGSPSPAALDLDPRISAKDLEFIEIYNPLTVDVALEGWRVRGGVEYQFASNEILPAQEAMVVLSFDPVADPERAAAFLGHYGAAKSPRLVGSWSGGLASRGEVLQLLRPELNLGEDQSLVLLTEDLFYFDEVAPWPQLGEARWSVHRGNPVAFGGEGRHWTTMQPTPGSIDFSFAARGDFTGDGQVDARDIDQLLAAIRMGSEVAFYELGAATSELDDEDVRILVQDVLGTRRGDANLDGAVNFADFLLLSANFGSTLATWSDGDFDGSGTVDFTDFLILSSQFGFDRASPL